MTLTEYEKSSALWLKIETELQERLQIYREKNDTARDPLETAKLRGTIALLKEILAWSEDQRPLMQ